MSVLLERGGNTSLSAASQALTALTVGLGWDARPAGPTGTGRAGSGGWGVPGYGGRRPAPPYAGQGRSPHDAGSEPVDPELDASAVLLGRNGKVLSDRHFVFFNNLTSPDGAVEHSGDGLVGAGDGDDGQLAIDLLRLDQRVEKIVIVLSLYDPHTRGHDFTLVHHAYVRVVERPLGRELARFDLPEEPQPETAMIFGEVYRYHGDWKFRAVGQGYASGLRGIAIDFGVDVT